MSEFVVTLRIKGEGSSAVASVDKITVATKKLGDESEKAASKAEKSWAKAGALAGTAVATIVTAIGALAQKSANAADELSKMSQKTGFTTESLSALKYQAGLAGANFQELQVSLNKFGRGVSEANSGIATSLDVFKAMKISVKDASGGLKPTSKLLEEVADKFAGMADGATKVDLAMSLFGRSGANMIPMLNGGSKAIRENAEEAKKLGVIYTAEVGRSAEQFNDNVSRLKSGLEGLGNKLITKLLPSFEALTNKLVDGAKETGMFDSVADGLATTIEFVVRVFIVAKGVIEQVTIVLAAGVATIVETVSVLWDTGKALIQFGQAMVALQTGQFSQASALAKDASEKLAKSWVDSGNRVNIAWEVGGEMIKETADKTRGLLDAMDEPAKKLAARGALFKNVIGGVGKYAGDIKNDIVDMTPTVAGLADKAIAAAKGVDDALGKIAALAISMKEVTSPIEQEWVKFNAGVLQVSEALDAAKAKIAEEYVITKDAALATEQYALAQASAATAITELGNAKDAHLAKIEKERDILSLINKEHTTEIAKVGLSARQLAGYNAVIANTTRVQAAFGGELKNMPGYLEKTNAQVKENALALFDATEKADDLKSILAEYGEIKFGDTMEGQMQKVRDAFAAGAIDAETMNSILAKMGSVTLTQNLEKTKNFLGAIKSVTKEGSKGYKAMEMGMAAISIIQDVIALKSAVTAVLDQGKGDPYTAFGRMAAMAAAVAPFIASIGVSMASFGGGGGGFKDTSEAQQKLQGTGSILGDSSAKSESILNAVEATRSATEKLVGINSGMLNALNTLVRAISNASNLLAQGAGDADFSGVKIPTAGSLAGPFSGKGILGRILTGSSKLTDEGIIIFAGALNSMLESVAVGAYQEISSRSWMFGSTQTNIGTVDISNEFGKQFSLIMKSIADTVREGALALGILPAEIEAWMAAYKIEETRISLKGLTGEEKQKELEAVFGKIFDGLAAAVVPFIGQFQQVGEGLGETLVRVATSVQVVQESIRYLGITIDETDPEKFAQIAVGLVDLMGGVDGFIQGMTTFTNAFATDAYKFQTAQSELADAFAEVGLAVPGTKEAMWALMQTLDATTEEGRKQIAALLKLSGVAATYYQMLNKATDEATKFLESLGLIVNPMSDFTKKIIEIHNSTNKAIESSNVLAKANGRQSASVQQLTKIRLWSLAQEAAAIRKLAQDTQDLIAKLYGGLPGSLDAINEQIAKLEGATSGVADGISDVESASNSLFEAWASGIKTVQDYLDSMLLGDLSALTPEEQLVEAQRQLRAMQARAIGGDADALNQLPQLADMFLRILRESGASGADYNSGFQWVRDLLQSVVGMENPGTQGGATSTTELVPSAELKELYAARALAEAEQNKLMRQDFAMQLVQNLADMATIMKVSVLDLIDAQKLDFTKLAEDVGVNFDDLNAQSIAALGFLATTLNISMTDLTDKLGISLVDLKGGLTEMTQSIGIDLLAMTVESTQTLAALSASLGMTLTEMTSALGINLGELTDATSLINQGLGAEINALPEGQRDELQPLFQAITDATNEADANLAIKALENAVNLIGGETANSLAPYLEGVMPKTALEQLDYLEDISRVAQLQLDTLGLIRQNLAASNTKAGIPSYASGTPYVQGDQIAQIHNGESVVPSEVNSWLRTSGWQLGGGSNDKIVVQLQMVNQRLEMIERSNATGQDKIAQVVEVGNDRARNQRDDIARREKDTARSRQ